MSAFGTELARLMQARGPGVRELGRQVPCNPGHISNLRSGRAQPSAGLAADLDKALGAGGALAALAPAPGRGRTGGPDFWPMVMRSPRWSLRGAPGPATWGTA